jgi:hypothetical protein
MSTKRERRLLNVLRQAAADFTTLSNRTDDPKIRALAQAYARTTIDEIKSHGEGTAHGYFPEDIEAAS